VLLKGMTLRFIWANTYRNRMAIIHENESIPWQKRVVSIELTPEQLSAIQPQHLGSDCGQPVYEEFFEVIAEPIYEEGEGK